MLWVGRDGKVKVWLILMRYLTVTWGHDRLKGCIFHVCVLDTHIGWAWVGTCHAMGGHMSLLMVMVWAWVGFDVYPTPTLNLEKGGLGFVFSM